MKYILPLLFVCGTAHAEMSYCLIRDLDCRVLLVRETPDSKLELPGGTVEGDEGTKRAAAREVMEETGLRVKDMTHLFNFTNAHVYACTVWSYNIQPSQWDVFDVGFRSKIEEPVAPFVLRAMEKSPCVVPNER